MVKIAFWDNGLGERGTSVALYDYAHFNETLLGNESIILYNTNHYSNTSLVIQKFTNRFKVYGVDNWSYVDTILLDNKCDILYVIKSGEWEGQISNICKTIVHCVFSCRQPHGNVYCAIADWVPGNDGKFKTIPHMINLPNHSRNMRTKLNIPENATVFGRHGGYHQFDIQYVQQIVYIVAKRYTNIYFLFVNTRPFCENLPNIIHIPMIIDLDEKTEFINTCDAMIWARSEGETFGLAIAEFSTKNKPVIATKVGDISYIKLLGDKGIWYNNESTLYNILTTFNKEDASKCDWNAYKEYTPEKVMKIFTPLKI